MSFKNNQSLDQKRQSLEKYFHEVTHIITVKQNPASGLIPASVAKTAHGDYTDAWVRDNVYSILAVWGLALAYRRLDDDQGRAYELEHATIKCMRGLLFAMMRQAHKVEQFKSTQKKEHALHAKYSTINGETVVGDKEWGHLQIDATSIFLLFLAQMTVSGLHIIYTLDEVQFIQNLVFYIERGYRIPDYGIWERGNKINHGQPELNCSSIGMVVAALQAINGINLFGSRGGSSSVIHVLPDEIARNFVTLHSALPRESPSKEIDAALLAVISFPAFAVEDPVLRDRTRNEIIKKLAGNYGCKRFLRDGHQTAVEDHNRLHYEAHELKIFENVESEWPLFFTYLILDGLFYENKEQVQLYRKKLAPLLVSSNVLKKHYHSSNKQDDREQQYETSDSKIVMKLVPELYIVPAESIEEERLNPGSQERIPNPNIPLVWAQSLTILGNLIYDDLLSPADIDPLGLRLSTKHSKIHMNTVVQIVLLSESTELQSKLLMYGLETQTLENCAPITISKPSCLRDAYTYLGKNSKLNLTGRPDRPIGTLSTCKIYRCQGQLYSFLPHFMDREEFYLVSDNDYFVSLFEQEVSSIRNHWMQVGRPTMVVKLTSQMLGDLEFIDHDQSAVNAGKRNLLNFLVSISSSGLCHGARVRVGRLSEMINTACIESLDFLVNHGSESSEDWDRILKGQAETTDKIKLRGLSIADADSKASHYQAVCKKKSNAEILLSSPLNHGMGFAADREDLSPLRIEGITEKQTSSPDTEVNLIPFAVTLGDDSKVDEAINLLYTSIRLTDQIELLHYIHSCRGEKFKVPRLGTIQQLLEETYWGAMYEKQWSVVRTAAGLLKKNVNFLTGNLADLLLRQKPVTIGFRPNEYFIDTPQNPALLSQLIYDHCTSDIREGPLVQELITYLGSIIRSTPSVFSGIMRIRTHYFILALREEISRTMLVNEEEAIEHLMRMSPFEVKTLLQQILVSHDQVVAASDTPHPSVYQPSVPNKSFQSLKISCRSGGYFSGNFAEISIYRDEKLVNLPFKMGRAINLVAIDSFSGGIILGKNYDLHNSNLECDKFVKDMTNLDLGAIIIIVAKDDMTKNLSEAAVEAIESIGSIRIRELKYRDSYCCIGQKGAAPGSITEMHQESSISSTDSIEKTFDLIQPPGAPTKRGTLLATILPSDGWWIRRRRNDGVAITNKALNRVPNNFYPKVWHLLSKTKNIRVGTAILSSDPTISESTPEELNFVDRALQVERLLDNILDPAEHQIAVECLVVISRLHARNPELKITNDGFDIQNLVSHAIEAFWDSWIKNDKNQSIISPITSDRTLFQKVVSSASMSPIITTGQNVLGRSSALKARMSVDQLSATESDRFSILSETESDFSFQKNFKLARRIFFDLKQDGTNGTMFYLASACVKLIFGLAWDAEKIETAM